MMIKLPTFVIICSFVILALCLNTPPPTNLITNDTANVKFVAYLNISKNDIVVESIKYSGNFDFNNTTAYISINKLFHPNDKKLVGNWFSAEIYVDDDSVEKLIITPPHKQYNLTDDISKKIFNINKNEFCSFIWNNNPYNLTILAVKNGKLTKIDDKSYKITIPNNISGVLLNNGFGMGKIGSKVSTIDGVIHIDNGSLTAVEFVSESEDTTYKFKLEVVK